MSRFRLPIIFLLDVLAVGWGIRVLLMADPRRRIPPPDPRLDQINIRYFAYRGMWTEDVGKVDQLPVEMIGPDSAWVTVEKGPNGHTEVLVVRDGRAWKRGGATRGTFYP